jgi:hypothetical protein
VITKFIVLPILIPEPLVSLVHLFCLYDRHLHNYIALCMHDCCMHKSCLCYFTKPVAAGNSVVEDSLSPGKMMHPFVIYAALVMYVTSVSFSGIKILANYLGKELCLNMRPVTRSSQQIRASQSEKYAYATCK